MIQTLNLSGNEQEQTERPVTIFSKIVSNVAAAAVLPVVAAAGLLAGGAQPAQAQFGGGPAAAGPATPASQQFVSAYQQGAMVVFGSPASAPKLGIGDSSDVGIAALQNTANYLNAINNVVKANWTATTPDNIAGRVAGEVEQGIKTTVGPAVGAIASKMPGCAVEDPIKTIPTSFAGIFPDKEHYTVLLDKEVLALRAVAECVAPGSGAEIKVTATSATGSHTADKLLHAVPGGGIVTGFIKEGKDKREAAAIAGNQGAMATATGVNVFAAQAEAGAHKLAQIMQVPDGTQTASAGADALRGGNPRGASVETVAYNTGTKP